MEQPKGGSTPRASLRSRVRSRVQSRAAEASGSALVSEPPTLPVPQQARRSQESLAVSLRAARTSAEAVADTGQVALLALAPWAPRALLENVAVAASLASFFHPSEPTTVLAPRMESRTGAVLIVDVSGFTALTERLSRSGAAGIEALTRCVNDYFAAMLEVIFEHGGDVLRFVGDAMIVAFLANEELGDAKALLCGVALCAARCACKLASSLGHVQMQPDGSVVPLSATSQAAADGATLSLKLSLGAGQLRLFTLGGGGAAGEQRWEFFACDPIMPDGASPSPVFTAQIACADADGLKGVAVASPQVAELLASVALCDAERLPSGAFMLRSVTALTDATPALPPLPAALARGLELPPCMASLPHSEPATRAAVDLLQAFLLNSIRARILAGQYEFIDELRDCTVVFIGIPALTKKRAAGAPQVDECTMAQSAVLAVQRAVGEADGAFLQARCDEKGFIIVCAFGLPGYAHEDGPARGIRTALAAVHALAEVSLDARIGVTTGRLLCACVGAPGRVEFSAFGDAINLAARLMGSASEEHALLVDAATHERACDVAVFAPLPPLHVKGRAAAVTAFAVAPLCESARHQKASPVAGPRALPSEPSLLVGRTAALAAVVDALDATLSGARGLASGGVIVIKGDAGMGKSALLRAALEHAAPLALARGAVAASRGDASHNNTPLWPWRGVVCDLLMHAHAVATPTGDAHGAWCGLLAEALDFDLEELPELLPELLPEFRLSQMSRLDCVTAAVEALLRATLATRPVVIVLEDLHACDAASVRLAEALATSCPDALMLLTTRPLRADPDADASAAALSRLQKAPRTLTLRLTPLRLEETASMLQAGAGPDAPPLSPRLIAAVHDRTSGHPLYIEQVVKLLKQRLTDNSRSTELSGADLDSFLRSSSSIHAVVTQRIDALRPAAALTLKVAAVTGRTSAKLSLLTAIHPLHPSPRELALDLQELQRLEFLGGTDANDPDTVMFANTFVRDTAYELMATAQRRALHLAAAQALRGSDIRDAASGVVWHLSQAAEGATLTASDRDELVAAWAAAGEVASSRANHDEAARCFTSGADVASPGTPEVAMLRSRAAEAYAAAGRLPQAADAALTALRSLGLRIEVGCETRKRSRRFQACLNLLCAGCSTTTAAARSSTYLQPGESTVALRAARVLSQAAAALPQSADACSWTEHAHAARDASR